MRHFNYSAIKDKKIRFGDCGSCCSYLQLCQKARALGVVLLSGEVNIYRHIIKIYRHFLSSPLIKSVDNDVTIKK
ncbi:hypothetical protein IJ556_02740 [bacterium]|nr:hypothetical protein [bacterium]